jgi:hypothetical protein
VEEQAERDDHLRVRPPDRSALCRTVLKRPHSPLPAAGGAPARVDDLVQYEPLGPPWRKVTPSTVHGVDTALPEAKGWAWKWRGKGLLAVASSRWEVLGYGDEPAPPAPPPAEASPPAPMSALKDAPPAPVSALKDAKAGPKDAPAALKDEKRQWVVTYFASTLFTPAGIDVYSRHPDGLKPETMREIKDAFTKFEDPAVRRLADSLFEVEVKRESSS